MVRRWWINYCHSGKSRFKRSIWSCWLDIWWWKWSYVLLLSLLKINANKTIFTRCLMVSTHQADQSCFYFRISWILMERHWFYFFCPLHLVQGLRSLEHRLLQKLSMKNFDQKFRFLIKKWAFWCPNISRTTNFSNLFEFPKKGSKFKIF